MPGSPKANGLTDDALPVPNPDTAVAGLTERKGLEASPVGKRRPLGGILDDLQTAFAANHMCAVGEHDVEAAGSIGKKKLHRGWAE